MSRAWLRLTAGVFMAFVVSSAFAQGKGEVPDSLFDKAVEFIKRAEGWHRGQMPYIGYGHCLLPGETLTENLSKAQADSLLRSDLRKCCDAFREFENDACGHFQIEGPWQDTEKPVDTEAGKRRA